MKTDFPIHIEDVIEDCVTIGLRAEIDTWPYEAPTRDYPGCAAGSAVTDVYIVNSPDQESIHQLITALSGDDEISEVVQNGVTFALDRSKGIVVDSFDEETVHDYLDSL